MDGPSYRQAVLAHKDRLYGYAARFLGRPEDARDVAQEALVRLWEHRHELDGAPPRAWLLRTVHHLCVDRLRRAHISEDEVPVELADASTPSPEARACSRQLGAVVASALAALSPRDRSVLLLRDVEGLSYEECAQVLGVPLGTLKAIVHRARERARVRLAAAGVLP
jgi:RNA polymerase sigma factor (sigma-70 family)